MMSTEDRFWSRVDREGAVVRPELGPCWLWKGTVDRDGYGQFWAGRTVAAHRFSLSVAGHPPTPGACVCHRCDNPLCVNPAHLFEGSQADNMRDRDAKGRVARGQRHYKAKLSDEQVAEVRRRHAGGETQRALSVEFGVSSRHVNGLCRGEQRAT